ncbi:unnamed protein product [Schistosoma turkestanicum]|nr:unnamed protein product [Schistosoma turkestanicum]
MLGPSYFNEYINSQESPIENISNTQNNNNNNRKKNFLTKFMRAFRFIPGGKTNRNSNEFQLEEVGVELHNHNHQQQEQEPQHDDDDEQQQHHEQQQPQQQSGKCSTTKLSNESSTCMEEVIPMEEEIINNTHEITYSFDVAESPITTTTATTTTTTTPPMPQKSPTKILSEERDFIKLVLEDDQHQHPPPQTMFNQLANGDTQAIEMINDMPAMIGGDVPPMIGGDVPSIV